jgi:murein DD-endopeptidase MepM/ murein hydrolase activator NlpD
LDFDVGDFALQTGGYLSSYSQYLATTGVTTGPDVVERIATENSINPRLLLALLEYQTGWIYSQEPSGSLEFPLGQTRPRDEGLYKQLAWAVNQLSLGYYGWREGRLTEIEFKDGITARLAPDLNAGTAALQYYFAQLYGSEQWVAALNLDSGFPALYEAMFGSPWVRALSVEPLYPPDLEQPRLILPFMINQIWSYSGGPHGAWERDGAWAAVDFAPGSLVPGCFDTEVYTVAAASGLVVRSENGVVSIDLDGDGREQTGWVLIYLHIAEKGRIPAGSWVERGDLIGHPSCEGGFSTGTHLHLARKYNGEWIVADGPLPFVMSGWTVHAGEQAYEGTLTRGNQSKPANPLSPFESQIIRRSTDP